MNNKIKNELIKRYKLIKDRKVFDINDIEYSSKNKADDKNIVIKDGSLSDVIHTFVDTLVANFDEDELATFYNNIKTLAIEITDFDETIRKRKYESSHKTLAYYKIATNTIYILDTSNTGILYHELFHVSTARRVGTTSFNGFCQTNLLTSECIGEGINEGYTQLMAERYFKDSSVGNYNVLVYLVELLELIIGKDKMEHYYMTSDLYSLVNELKKYAAYEDICKFLSYLDYIVKHIYDTNLLRSDVKYFKKIFLFINEFLLKSYATKIANSDIDTEEEYEKCYQEFSYIVSRSIIYADIDNKRINCSFADDEDFVKELTRTLDKTGMYLEIE